ncbi:MAG TPA: hypothetical protein PKV98_04490 [Burkholderiaceae bacterium]|nr:hypothetical protein [Burkholderiaceae bacterium]
MDYFDFIPMFSPGNPIAYDNVSFEEERAAQNEADEREFQAAEASA